MYRTLPALAVALCTFFPPAARAADLVVAPGITIDMLHGWTARRDAAATWILERRNGDNLDAAMSITVEARDDHTDAMRQIAAIAHQYETPGTYTTIAGWPAVEQKIQRPYEDVQEGPPDPRITIPADGGDVLEWRTSTAVAAGNQLVMVNATLHPAAHPALADEALSIGRSHRSGPAAVEERFARSAAVGGR